MRTALHAGAVRAAARAPAFAALALAAIASLAGALAGCSRFAILHDPLTAAEHNDLGVAYEAAGKPDLARREYKRAIQLDPRLVRPRVNLGNIEAAEGRWVRAEEWYRLALREAPADADALNNLAIALVRQDKALAEAEMLAQRAVGVGGARDSLYRATLAEVRAAREARK